MSTNERLEWSSDPLYVDPFLFRRFVDFIERNGAIDLTKNNPHAFDALKELKRRPTVEHEGKAFCWDLVLDCDITRGKLCNIDNMLRAVEMEAGGFLRSLKLFTDKGYILSGLIFRGLSDHASNKAMTDEKATVKWREFAARNAATVMVEFIHDLQEQDFRPTELRTNSYAAVQ